MTQTKAAVAHTNNILIGAGELYLDLEDADGALTGERYLGDSVAAALSVTTQRTTVFSGDGPVARKLVDIATQTDRNLTMTLRDLSMENLAAFLAVPTVGELAALAADAALLNNFETRVVSKGRVIQLGQTDADPAGVPEVLEPSIEGAGAGGAADTNFVIEKADGTAWTYGANGDNWRLDAARGRLEIIGDPGGSVKVRYRAKKRNARRLISATGAPSQIIAAVRYLEAPASGRGRNIYARRCNVTASGEAAFKNQRQSEAQLALSCAIEDPGSGIPQLYIDGVAA